MPTYCSQPRWNIRVGLKIIRPIGNRMRQNQHGQSDEIPHPGRIVSTACHPWNPSWNLARPGSTLLGAGIRRNNPPDGITTKTRINSLIGTIGWLA